MSDGRAAREEEGVRRERRRRLRKILQLPEPDSAVARRREQAARVLRLPGAHDELPRLSLADELNAAADELDDLGPLLAVLVGLEAPDDCAVLAPSSMPS